MIDDQIEINADIDKRLTKLEATVNKSNFSEGLCFATAIATDKMNEMLEELEKRMANTKDYFPPSIVASAKKDYDLLKKLGFRKET